MESFAGAMQHEGTANGGDKKKNWGLKMGEKGKDYWKRKGDNLGRGKLGNALEEQQSEGEGGGRKPTDRQFARTRCD